MCSLQEKTLGECVELVIDHRGKTPAKMGGEWTDSGIRVISAANVHNGSIDNEDQIRCVSEEVYKKWMTDDICRNDCFIASEGASLGENCIWDSDEKIVLGQRLYAIRTNTSKLDPWYFAAYMQTKKFRTQIDQISTGSTVFGVSQPVLMGVKLLLPSIDIQRRIGHFYMLLKRKIENNKSIITELECMANDIYNYWFLQFDFPDMEDKPYKSSGGKMEWSDELKREIPSGWEVSELSRVCEFINGINYDKKEDGNKKYKIINVRNITSSSLLLDVSDFDEIVLPSDKAERYIVESDDILIARSGTPGAVRLLESNIEDVIFCGFIIRCKPVDVMLRYYLTYSLKRLEGTNATKTGGSILQNVSQDTLKSVKVVIPPSHLIKKYNDKLSDIIKKMQVVIEENQELISMRESIIPMLQNGQVCFK